MLKIAIIFVAIAIMFLPNTAHSDSTLWDLIINASPDEGIIERGAIPIISGHVIDHVGNPVSNSDITIRSGVDTLYTTTNENGFFTQSLTDFDGLPGNYIVNIRATLDDKIGLQSVQFQVSGEVKQSEIIYHQINNPTAQGYLESDESDHENNPIGMQMYHYYQELQQQYLDAINIETEEIEKQQILDEQKEYAEELLQLAINEKKPGVGIYSGYGYDRFVGNLDVSVKDTIIGQLNYTTNALLDAQNIMDSVLDDGGSVEEARNAYLERLSTSHEMMNVLAVGGSIEDVTSVEMEESTAIIEEEVIELPIIKEPLTEEPKDVILNTNSTSFEVKTIGSSIFININGTITQFIINGTQLIQISNPTE